jgi:hypothetical protein
MTATHSLDSTASVSPVLYLAFELSAGQWKLASTTARGQRARLVSVPARNTPRVLVEIARAKSRFGLPQVRRSSLATRPGPMASGSIVSWIKGASRMSSLIHRASR